MAGAKKVVGVGDKECPLRRGDEGTAGRREIGGVAGVGHGAGTGSRRGNENGTMGALEVPRDPYELLKKNVEGRKFMNDDVE